MRWLFLPLLAVVLLGTCLAAMMLLFPGAGWIENARWFASAFVLAAGCGLAVVIIEKIGATQ